jgi:uncharacterized protein YggE
MKYEQNGNGSLEASGTGTIEVAPDLAVVRLTVLTEAPTAAEAVRQNAERMREVLDAVEGLPHQRVSTVGLSVQPIFTYDPATGRSTITGYRAENSIKVDTAVDQAGRIFDAGISAGANESSGITFKLQDERPFRDEALYLAYRQAYTDASAVANAADVALVGPEQITIEPESSGPRPFELARVAAEDVPTPVLPGMLTVTATVRVRFAFQSE